MKKISLIILNIFLICPAVWAAELKMTSYFPAPNMVIDRATFHPRDPLAAGQCNNTTIGTIYYDNTTDNYVACHKNADASITWNKMPGVWKQETTQVFPVDASVTAL